MLDRRLIVLPLHFDDRSSRSRKFFQLQTPTQRQPSSARKRRRDKQRDGLLSATVCYPRLDEKILRNSRRRRAETRHRHGIRAPPSQKQSLARYSWLQD